MRLPPPWVPRGDSSVQRFINDIVLEEESDEGIPLKDGTVTYSSHFELYVKSMEEVKVGSSKDVEKFIDTVINDSLESALFDPNVPEAAREFMNTTFDFIKSDKPHVIAAAFALGREHIIPEMFRALLNKMNITKEQAEVFHYYLERHIELDTDHHGPMSLLMLVLLCDNDSEKIKEAEQAAIDAVKARIKFWDGVLEVLEKK